MKNKGAIFFTFLMVLLLACPLASAQGGLDVTIDPIAPVIIKELEDPAIFNVTLTNNLAVQDSYSFETLLNYDFQPSGPIQVNATSSKNFILKVFFSEKAREEHAARKQFPYYIKSNVLDKLEGNLYIRIVPLADAISIEVPETVNMHDASLPIIIENKEDARFEVSFEIESDIFDKTITATLEPNERKELTIELEKDKIWRDAGSYELDIKLGSGDFKIVTEKNITLEETVDIQTDEHTIDLIFYKREAIKKTNAGNTLQKATVTIKLSPFSEAFTSFSILPDSSEEVGDTLVYTWERDLKLGESLQVVAVTNYLLPIGIILVIALLVLLYSKKQKYQLTIEKKIVKVRTKSGEFATKVILNVTNHGKAAESITLRDSIPLVTKIYERFGERKPDKSTQNQLWWKIDSLVNGQRETFSYIIYAPMGVVGTITLPQAEADYTSEGKKKIARSNKVHLLV